MDVECALRNPARLVALRRPALLDTPPEHSFDPLTDLAASVMTEIALRTEIPARREAETELQRLNAELDARVQTRTAEVTQAQGEILERLARAAEYRDYDTSQHTQRVAHTAALLA